MLGRKTLYGWFLFVLTACSKSLCDIAYFRRDGTLDTIFYGRQAFSSHPVWCSVNVMLDLLAVWGAIDVVWKAISARWCQIAGRR